MTRILLTIFVVLLTLMALGCEQRLAGGPRTHVRHIVAVATAAHTVEDRAGGLREAGHAVRSVAPAATAGRAVASAPERTPFRTPWLSSDVEDDDDGSRGSGAADGDEPTAPPAATALPARIPGFRICASPGPLTSGVGPSLGHVRITKPPPRPRTRA